MSKFSSKNKLIEKQLKQLNKKEEKLILEKEPGIIKNKLEVFRCDSIIRNKIIYVSQRMQHARY